MRHCQISLRYDDDAAPNPLACQVTSYQSRDSLPLLGLLLPVSLHSFVFLPLLFFCSNKLSASAITKIPRISEKNLKKSL